MASKAQINANRRNSKKSTGPKTSEGKSRTKMNALKHGLTAQTVVILGEDPVEFYELICQIEQEHEPVGRLGYELLRRVAVDIWRLQRCDAMEAEVLSLENLERQQIITDSDYCDGFENLTKARKRSLSKSGLKQENDELDNLESDEEDEKIPSVNPLVITIMKELMEISYKGDQISKNMKDLAGGIGPFFLIDPKYPNALEQIQRYRASIERSLDRSLGWLRRLQRDREEHAAAHAKVADA